MTLNISYANVVHNGTIEKQLNHFTMGIEILKGTLIVPVVLAIVIVPYSLLIGWNLTTLFLFWFIIIPALAIYLPTRVSNNKNHLFESLVGLIMFYAFMVFMIYNHYQTDYFQIMMLSCVVNMILISTITEFKRAKALYTVKDS